MVVGIPWHFDFRRCARSGKPIPRSKLSIISFSYQGEYSSRRRIIDDASWIAFFAVWLIKGRWYSPYLDVGGLQECCQWEPTWWVAVAWRVGDSYVSSCSLSDDSFCPCWLGSREVISAGLELTVTPHTVHVWILDWLSLRIASSTYNLGRAKNLPTVGVSPLDTSTDTDQILLQ